MDSTRDKNDSQVRVYSERTRERRMERYYERKAAGLCPQCGKQPPTPGKAWCAPCRERWNHRTRTAPKELQRKWDKAARVRLHEQTMLAYGGHCVCCGDSHLAFLEIDHVNGGGTAHRKALGGQQGQGFYQNLRRLGYPKENLQVLCANCHRAKTRNLPCPPSHLGRPEVIDLETRVQKDRRHVDPSHGGRAVPAQPKQEKSPLPEQHCLQCGNLMLGSSPSAVRRATFCGNDCKFAYQRIHPTRAPRLLLDAVCRKCGNDFQYYPKNYAGTYCSSSCRRAKAS